MSNKWYVQGLPKACDRWVNLIECPTKAEALQALKRVRRQDRHIEDEYLINLHDFSALKVTEYHVVQYAHRAPFHTNPHFPPTYPTITS